MIFTDHQDNLLWVSPLHAHTASPLTSTVQDPSFRQGLAEHGLTEIVWDILLH
jgi:hypothetical protein